MDFVPWFNPENKQHLIAYNRLIRETGIWDERLCPRDLTLCNQYGVNWQSCIERKIINSYLIHMELL